MKQAATIATIAGLLIASLAAGYLLLAPCAYRGVTQTEMGGESSRESFCISLVEANGTWVIGLVAIPVVVAGVAVIFSRHKMRASLGLCALFSLLYSLMTGFTIGLYFIPASLALTIAAILLWMRPREAPPATFGAHITS